MLTRAAAAWVWRAMPWAIAACASAATDFNQQVRPIIESRCLGCHGAERALGGLRLDSAAGAAKAIRAGDPEASPLIRSVTLAPTVRGAMPPGGPALSAAQVAILRQWVQEGAAWPSGLTLAGARKAAPDDLALVEKIRAKILANSPEKSPAEMKPYEKLIPGSTVGYQMVPIPGGTFRMGSPDAEVGRKKDEGPVHPVSLEPFWMEKFEVTWDEYRLFMFAERDPATQGANPEVDAVSRPTRPYVEMSFGMGINGYPAISMTQHAANKYAQWLSAKTGHFYRLPTEAEWEYACRAGATTTYSFGDSPAALGEYAWFAANSEEKYQKVGQKKPNAWGLHDMHGNVAEWTLDQYDPGFYARPEATGAAPLNRPTKPYPHAARGGGWSDDPAQLRCAARVGSDASWKMQDPQLPKSIWYLTDAQFLGFRLVRPLKVPTAAEMFRFWNSGTERD